MSDTYSVEQMTNLQDALKKAEYSPEDVNMLCSNVGALKQLKSVLSTFSEDVIATEHVIDCDQDPLTPDGWRIVENSMDGLLKWNPEEISLHLTEEQKDEKTLGTKIQRDISNLDTLNANVLDYLIDNPSIIPEDWKKFQICFWGTIYMNSSDQPCVRYLYWNNGWWAWHHYHLDSEWNEHCVAPYRKAA